VSSTSRTSGKHSSFCQQFVPARTLTHHPYYQQERHSHTLRHVYASCTCGCTAITVADVCCTQLLHFAWWCRYSDAVTYGELFLQNEYEMSCYNLDEADVAEQRKRFNLYEAEVGPHALCTNALCSIYGASQVTAVVSCLFQQSVHLLQCLAVATCACLTCCCFAGAPDAVQAPASSCIRHAAEVQPRLQRAGCTRCRGCDGAC
jgi:hypothetical protein